jgi:tRNA pseudouridine38-40 synthase
MQVEEVVATPGDVKPIKVAAVVEYHGAHFHGWQRQKHHPEPTIQAALEDALSKIANQSISVVCAGRTDAGVHASTQVIHFETTAKRKPYNWIRGANTQLPDGIAIRWLDEVADDFHARFSATARRYRYLIYNKEVKQGLLHDQLTWCRFPLDEAKMHQAAQSLLGENDFTSFRAKDCQSNTPYRNVQSISVRRYSDIVMIEVQANAFLYHMIRNIAGVLMPIGMGRKPVSWCAELLEQKDRSKAGVTAPSDGLYFVGVEYPQKYNIPSQPWGPVFVEPWLEKSALNSDV